MNLLENATVTIGAGGYQSATFELPADTVSVRLLLERPPTKAENVRVVLVQVADGVETPLVRGNMTGGERLNSAGVPLLEYGLEINLTVQLGEAGREYMKTATPDEKGFFHNVPLTRITELSPTGVYLLLTSDSMASVRILALEAVQGPPATVSTKNSVSVTGATSGKEIAGDGVFSFSHTATGTNRAAFIGTVTFAVASGDNEVSTYGGAGTTELWDAVGNAGNDAWHSGNYIIAPATGSQTVETDHGATEPSEQYLGVVSFEGVHQTTAVGTPNTATFTTATDVTVTVAGTTAGGMLVDSMLTDGPGSAPSIGANQTPQNTQSTGTKFFRQSSQVGSFGGVMNWTADTPDYSFTGSVEFKESAAAAEPVFLDLAHTAQHQVLMTL